jgi:hypothetical protein
LVLMELLTFISGWNEGWLAASIGKLDVNSGRREPSLPKQAAWIEIEGLHRAGQLTVWETGEANWRSTRSLRWTWSSPGR